VIRELPPERIGCSTARVGGDSRRPQFDKREGEAMNYQINVNEVDADGAIREAAHEVSADTRLSFLKKAGLAGGAVIGGGAVL
jgi:hypothetical protein